MPDNRNTELLTLLEAVTATGREDVELKDALTSLLLNPNTANIKLSRLSANPSNVLSETRTRTRINSRGDTEEIQEEIIHISMLDDGTSANRNGIVICQTCGATVREENIKRCPCGKTVCVRPRCGYKAISEKWFCSFWCILFHF